MDNQNDSATLTEALQRVDIQLDRDKIDRLDHYRTLLWDWNTKLNLTRHTSLDTFASRDVLDSWQLAQLLADREEVLDVGSGGGVPGIVLAVLRPDLEVSLCESTQKKARALNDIIDQLGLNVAAHHGRAESLIEDFRFDSVVARAVGPLWKICTWFEPHWNSFSRMLLIKGPRWTDERLEARQKGLLQNLDLRRAAEYPMAGTQSNSVILQLSRKASGSA